MNHRISSITAALAAAALAACGGKVFVDLPSTGTGGAGGAGGMGGTGPQPVVGPGPGPGPGPVSMVSSSTFSTSSGGNDCFNAPDCNQCCIDTFSGAYEILLKDFVFECACQPGSPCEMQCALPGGGCQDLNTADQPCTDCLTNISQNDEPCIQKTIQDCESEPQCAQVLDCFNTC